MTMRASRVFVVAVVALAIGALVGGGFALASQHRGGDATVLTPPGGPIAYPTDADAIVLQVSKQGGFVAPQATLGREPAFTLYGDGTIVEGPPVAAPADDAIPSLHTARATEAGVQAILRQAQVAGLFGPSRVYTAGGVVDAGAETFALSVDGARRTVAFAGDLSSTSANLPAGELAARRRFGALEAKLADPSSWLPAGDVGAFAPYAFDRMAVYVNRGAPRSDARSAHAWPLSVPLPAFGRPTSDPGFRCGVVEGTDLHRLVSAADGTRSGALWVGGDGASDAPAYPIVFRPMLPGDTGC